MSVQHKGIKIMKELIFKVLDPIGAGFMWIGAVIMYAFAAVGVSAAFLLSVVLSLGVPIFCLIASWGILKYFGVL